MVTGKIACAVTWGAVGTPKMKYGVRDRTLSTPEQRGTRPRCRTVGLESRSGDPDGVQGAVHTWLPTARALQSAQELRAAGVNTDGAFLSRNLQHTLRAPNKPQYNVRQ